MPRKPCAAIFMTPVIGWNGDVTTCCHDPLLELKIGNVNETPLKELWYSDEMTRRRIAQIKGDFSYPKRCLHCKNVDGIEITHEQVIDYLQNIGREDLIKQYVKRHNINLKSKSKLINVSTEKIVIDVFSPSKKSLNSGFYKGEDGFNKGYNFIYGSKKGFFEYDFPGKADSIEINLQMASKDWASNKKTKYKVYLNHKLLGEGSLEPIASGLGQKLSFFSKGNVFPKNILRIEFEGSLCIMGNALDKDLKDSNIEIRLIKNDSKH